MPGGEPLLNKLLLYYIWSISVALVLCSTLVALVGAAVHIGITRVRLFGPSLLWVIEMLGGSRNGVLTLLWHQKQRGHKHPNGFMSSGWPNIPCLRSGSTQVSGWSDQGRVCLRFWQWFC